MSFSTPILFIIFNRPETTFRVFEEIRTLQPQKLYITADGPRDGNSRDIEKCSETRKIIERIDWMCEVQTQFSDINLGCKIGVSSGINWFFEHVEEGIILEDDCVPDRTFFLFCETLLKYYRNNERILHIGGSNFQDGIIRGDGSYYFSTITHIWGWATWRRAWKKYDVSMTLFPNLLQKNQFAKLFTDSHAKKYWLRNFELAYSNKKDTWDIQWMFTLSVNNGLTIIPNVNLISNIGFDSGATHTFNHSDPTANRPITPLTNIVHPSVIIPDIQGDAYTIRKYLNPNKFRKLWRLFRQFV